MPRRRRAPALRCVAARRLTGDLARLGHPRSHLTPSQNTNVSAYWKLNLNFEENQYIMLCRASSIASSGPGQLMAWPESLLSCFPGLRCGSRAVVRPGVALLAVLAAARLPAKCPRPPQLPRSARLSRAPPPGYRSWRGGAAPATSHRQPSIDPGLSEAAPASPAPVAPLPNFKCPSGERGGGGAGRGAEVTQPTAPLSAHIPTCCRLSHNNIDFYPTGHLGHRNRSG